MGPGLLAVTDCGFEGNQARNGGAVNYQGTDAEFSGCEFRGNLADSWGGGVRLFDHGQAKFMNCVFVGNTAAEGAGAICSTGWWGGDNQLDVVNTTFASNDAVDGRAVGCDGLKTVLKIANSVLWDGGNEVYLSGTSTEAISSSTVFGGWAGNLDVDPCFVLMPNDGGDGWGVGDNDDFGDVHLQAVSPCVDAGSNGALPLDYGDVDGDGITTEVTPWDIDGDARVFDCGGGAIVDMGADECVDVYVPEADVLVHVVGRVSASSSDVSAVLPDADVDGETGAGGEPFWQRERCEYLAEVWLRSADALPAAIGGGSVILGFDPCVAAAQSVGHGTVFVDDPCDAIDNVAGSVMIAGWTTATDMGDDEYVLLGRVTFVGVAAIDEVGEVFGPYDMGLTIGVGPAAFDMVGHGSAGGQFAAEPSMSIKSIVYDVDDDDWVDLRDWSAFAASYGASVGEPVGPGGPYAAWADFDGSGEVDGVDLALFLTGYLAEDFCDGAVVLP